MKLYDYEDTCLRYRNRGTNEEGIFKPTRWSRLGIQHRVSNVVVLLRKQSAMLSRHL